MFSSNDVNGIPYYHTNVMMWIGTKVAAVCDQSIPDEKVFVSFSVAYKKCHKMSNGGGKEVSHVSEWFLIIECNFPLTSHILKF